MDHLNDFPKHTRNNAIDDAAQTAFEAMLRHCQCFKIQSMDNRDYGRDYQLEVLGVDHATNVRISVQLKGTESDPNADNSVSVSVSPSNVNYMMVQPYSFYVCHHLPTDRLMFRMADSVHHDYNHHKSGWAGHSSVTVRFTDALDHAQLERLAGLARCSLLAQRDDRARQGASDAGAISAIIRDQVPDLFVPMDRRAALERLQSLYEANEDRLISANFDKFAAVFGATHPAMTPCYMSEINLGMARRSQYEDRIRTAITVFEDGLSDHGEERADLLYCIGNAWTALNDEERAAEYYLKALEALPEDGEPVLRGQCLKNLGDIYARLGRTEAAIAHYKLALDQVPDLPEAHHSLGEHCLKVGQFKDALAHFDQTVFPNDRLGRTTSLNGWRINALFNLGQGANAFREIFGLLSNVEQYPWIWTWTAQQVATFGRESIENAQSALRYWDRYIKVHPEWAGAWAQRLGVKIYLRAHGQLGIVSYQDLKAEFDLSAQALPDDAKAFLLDRLGNMAQDEDNWTEAEACFRGAYDLKGGEYGYCLGVALNELERFEESLPLLRHQAEVEQPDAMSWRQVAEAYQGMGRLDDCVEAYWSAVKIEPEDPVAWFELGGAFWNAQRYEDAFLWWHIAIDRFPDHASAQRLLTESPFVEFLMEGIEDDAITSADATPDTPTC